MHRCAGWIDAILSRAVVEPRFVSRRAADRAAWLAEMRLNMQRLSEDDWYAAPPSLEPRSAVAGRYRGEPTQTIQWQPPAISAFERLGIFPRTGRPIVTMHGNRQQNAWILLHGWLGGTLGRDRRGWPFDRMLQQFDLICVVLPGHGPRRNSSDARWPTFPSRNPIANATGLALAVAELRQLMGWLRSHGYCRLGIAGTSLGAYVAALYATVSADCDRLLLDRPFVRMSEPLRRVALRRGAEDRDLITLLDAVYAPVSPLARPLRMPSERIDLILGRKDRVAGSESGEALAAQWGIAPVWFPGSHVMPLGRSERLWDRFLKLDLTSQGVRLP